MLIRRRGYQAGRSHTGYEGYRAEEAGVGDPRGQPAQLWPPRHYFHLLTGVVVKHVLHIYLIHFLRIYSIYLFHTNSTFSTHLVLKRLHRDVKRAVSTRFQNQVSIGFRGSGLGTRAWGVGAGNESLGVRGWE